MDDHLGRRRRAHRVRGGQTPNVATNAPGPATCNHHRSYPRRARHSLDFVDLNRTTVSATTGRRTDTFAYRRYRRRSTTAEPS